MCARVQTILQRTVHQKININHVAATMVVEVVTDETRTTPSHVRGHDLMKEIESNKE